MALPLNTLSLVGGALVWGVGKLRDRRDKRAREAEAKHAWDAPTFESEEDVKLFTEVAGGIRSFSPDVRAKLADLLDLRSLEPLQPSMLAADPSEAQAMGALGSYYAVVPLQDDFANAGQVLRECEKTGAVVAGSLTLVFLPTGIDLPMLLVVGGKSLQTGPACNERGSIALLTKAPPVDAPKDVAPANEVVRTEVIAPLNGSVHRAIVQQSSDNPPADHEEL